MTLLPADVDDVASHELCFLFDHAIVARRNNLPDNANAFVRAAECLIRATLRHHSREIGLVASRKGDGELIATDLVLHLSPRWAAAVYLLWSFRGARQPALRVLSSAFGTHPSYQSAVRTLCRRLFEA